MSIRIQHLHTEADDNCYLRATGDAKDSLHDETYRADLLSLVRHIMRERGDCNRIPIVRAFVTHPVNEWGHNAQVEVQYHDTYRAIYGAHLGERVTNVQCYMD